MPNINVRRLNGESYSIEIDVSCTVKHLKERVMEKSQVAVCHQELMIDEDTLEDDDLLSTYFITDGETIHLNVLTSANVHIQLASRTVVEQFQLGSRTTIKELRAKVVSLSDSSDFTLSFNSEVLSDAEDNVDKTFADYDIRTGSTVQAIFRTHGGPSETFHL